MRRKTRGAGKTKHPAPQFSEGAGRILRAVPPLFWKGRAFPLIDPLTRGGRRAFCTPGSANVLRPDRAGGLQPCRRTAAWPPSLWAQICGLLLSRRSRSMRESKRPKTGRVRSSRSFEAQCFASGLRYFSGRGRPFRARGSAPRAYDISLAGAALSSAWIGALGLRCFSGRGRPFERVGRRLGLTMFLRPGPPFSGAWVGASGLRCFSGRCRPF